MKFFETYHVSAVVAPVLADPWRLLHSLEGFWGRGEERIVRPFPNSGSPCIRRRPQAQKAVKQVTSFALNIRNLHDHSVGFVAREKTRTLWGSFRAL